MCAEVTVCCRRSKKAVGSPAVEEAEAGCSLEHTAGQLHARVHFSPTFASLSLLATTGNGAPSSSTPPTAAASTHRTSLIAICTRPLCGSSDRITSSMPGWYLQLE